MDDDLISKAPLQDISSPDTDQDQPDAEASKVRIFDITPDLNISPAKDEVEEQAPSSKIVFNTPIIQPPSQPTPVVPKKEPEMSVPRYGPANPPAKTIGPNVTPINKISEIEKLPDPTTSTLQEAVSSIQEQTKKPEKVTVEVKNDPNVKSLRTYEKDFAEAMARKRLSTASIIIAEGKKIEAKKAETKQVEIEQAVPAVQPIQSAITPSVVAPSPIKRKSHTTRNWILSLMSLILVVGGIITAYYLYSQSPLAPLPTPTKAPAQQFPSTIIPVDSQKIINIDGLNKTRIDSMIRTAISNSQSKNVIEEIIPVQTVGDKLTRVYAEQMLSSSEIITPDIFKRSLMGDWMLGIYNGKNNQKNVFVITTNNFFQNTFAGVIQWEKTMAEDLKDYLYSGNTTSNATPSSSFTLRGEFKDRIIENKDVREYVADNGHIIFLYSFISNNKLVITNSEDALQEIIIRLEKRTSVR